MAKLKAHAKPLYRTLLSQRKALRNTPKPVVNLKIPNPKALDPKPLTKKTCEKNHQNPRLPLGVGPGGQAHERNVREAGVVQADHLGGGAVDFFTVLLGCHRCLHKTAFLCTVTGIFSQAFVYKGFGGQTLRSGAGGS